MMMAPALSRLRTTSGSPGIGKSFFLLYFMHHLVMRCKASTDHGGRMPVIVLQRLDQLPLCFQGGTVVRLTLEAFYAQLDDPNTW